MCYYGNGYGGAPMTGGYAPYGNAYPIQNNNTSLWAIILVVFILFTLSAVVLVVEVVVTGAVVASQPILHF